MASSRHESFEGTPGEDITLSSLEYGSYIANGDGYYTPVFSSFTPTSTGTSMRMGSSVVDWRGSITWHPDVWGHWGYYEFCFNCSFDLDGDSYLILYGSTMNDFGIQVIDGHAYLGLMEGMPEEGFSTEITMDTWYTVRYWNGPPINGWTETGHLNPDRGPEYHKFWLWDGHGATPRDSADAIYVSGLHPTDGRYFRETVARGIAGEFVYIDSWFEYRSNTPSAILSAESTIPGVNSFGYSQRPLTIDTSLEVYPDDATAPGDPDFPSNIGKWMLEDGLIDIEWHDGWYGDDSGPSSLMRSRTYNVDLDVGLIPGSGILIVATIRDYSGRVNYVNHSVNLGNSAPLPLVAGVPSGGAIYLNSLDRIFFDSSPSGDPEGDEFTSFWEVENIDTSNILHNSFGRVLDISVPPGTYRVGLTVEDQWGAKDSISWSKMVVVRGEAIPITGGSVSSGWSVGTTFLEHSRHGLFDKCSSI